MGCRHLCQRAQRNRTTCCRPGSVLGKGDRVGSQNDSADKTGDCPLPSGTQPAGVRRLLGSNARLYSAYRHFARGAGRCRPGQSNQSMLGSAQDSADPDAKPNKFDALLKTFLDRDTLTGDWFGFRTTLQNAGITFGLLDQSEVWGNLSGGLRQGAVFDGLTTASLKLD